MALLQQRVTRQDFGDVVAAIMRGWESRGM
jgi:hypothetical protein